MGRVVVISFSKFQFLHIHFFKALQGVFFVLSQLMESLGPKNLPDATAIPSTAGCWSVPQMSQVQRIKRPASVTRLCSASLCLSQNWSKKKVKVKTKTARSGGGRTLVHDASGFGGRPGKATDYFLLSFHKTFIARGLQLRKSPYSLQHFLLTKSRICDICNSACKTHRFYYTAYPPNFTLNWWATLILMGKERFPKGPLQPCSFLLFTFTPLCCICITLWMGKIRSYISICPILAEYVINCIKIKM